MKRFWDLAKGFKVDVDGYDTKEKELELKIAELEGQRDPLSIASLRTYKRYLNLLQQRKKERY